MDTAKSSTSALLSVSIPRRLREKLLQYAVAQQTSAAAVVEAALDTYFRTREEWALRQEVQHGLQKVVIRPLIADRRRFMHLADAIGDCIQAVKWMRDVTLAASPQGAEQLYFIVAEGTDFVKIGRSINPRARLGELQVGCMYRLTLAATVRVHNAVEGEAALHHLLARYCFQGEWFQIPASILEILLARR